MKHVVHLFGSFGPGGAEMGAVRLIQSLPGIRHTVVSIGSDVRLAEETGVEHVSLGLDGRSLTAGLQLAKLCRELGADIIHVNNLAPWPDAVLAAKLTGARVVQTFHGVEQAALRFPAHKRVVYQLLDRASDALVAVAGSAADLLSGLTGIGRQRIRVIPNGVDTGVFHPVRATDKSALRANLGLPEHGLLFGCVAALRPVKDHAGLLRAFAQVRQDQPRYLVLAGNGPLAADLRRQAENLGCGDNIVFLGRRSDVPDLLRAFDAFVLNSETEGLSFAVLEAMASGLPIVASNVGGNPELVTTGREGWLYERGDQDALTGLLQRADGSQLASMGAAARQRVEAYYSLAAMAAAYADVYGLERGA